MNSPGVAHTDRKDAWDRHNVPVPLHSSAYAKNPPQLTCTLLKTKRPTMPPLEGEERLRRKQLAAQREITLSKVELLFELWSQDLQKQSLCAYYV